MIEKLAEARRNELLYTADKHRHWADARRNKTRASRTGMTATGTAMSRLAVRRHPPTTTGPKHNNHSGMYGQRPGKTAQIVAVSREVRELYGRRDNFIRDMRRPEA